ncbi:hypothetical protein NMY22_g19329 [Coprinellus aureogranulatus]|nr:hypothetical protein NMY22_g19329 [Coprinellus aureogranulatus]
MHQSSPSLAQERLSADHRDSRCEGIVLYDDSLDVQLGYAPTLAWVSVKQLSFVISLVPASPLRPHPSTPPSAKHSVYVCTSAPLSSRPILEYAGLLRSSAALPSLLPSQLILARTDRIGREVDAFLVLALKTLAKTLSSPSRITQSLDDYRAPTERMGPRISLRNSLPSHLRPDLLTPSRRHLQSADPPSVLSPPLRLIPARLWVSDSRPCQDAALWLVNAILALRRQ